jgi:hypothetical protein
MTSRSNGRVWRVIANLVRLDMAAAIVMTVTLLVWLAWH